MKKKMKFSVKTVSGATNLPIQTAVIVPSTRKGDKKAAASTVKSRVNDVRRFMSNRFGGYTSSKSTGGYVMKNGKLVKERVNTVTAFASRQKYKKHKAAWLSYVRKKGKSWGQETMGIIIENDMKYIKSKK